MDTTKTNTPNGVSLIVPCLNEEQNVPCLVGRIASLKPEALGWQVIIVDDGSTDRTAAIAQKICEVYPWLRLVKHSRNLGLGAAVRTGFQHSSGSIICTIDADCSFAPERLPELIEAVRRGADIATASPWHPKSDEGRVHPLRRVLSRGCSALYRMVLRSDVYCYTSLLRAYRRDVFQSVQVRSDGFVSVAEMLVLALRRGYRVEEMPVRLDRRIYGVSKISVLDSIRSHVSLLTRIPWMRHGTTTIS